MHAEPERVSDLQEFLAKSHRTPALRAQPTHSVVTSRAASRLHSLLPWPQNGPGALRLRDQVIQPVHPAHRRCERGSGRPAARCAPLTIRPPLSRLLLLTCSLKRGYCRSTAPFDEAPGRMPAVGGAGADINLGACMCAYYYLVRKCEHQLGDRHNAHRSPPGGTVTSDKKSGHKTSSLSSTAVRPLPRIAEHSTEVEVQNGLAGLPGRWPRGVRDLHLAALCACGNPG